MAIERSNAQTAISQRRGVQQRLSLVALLAGLAEARQANVSDRTYELYSAALSGFPEADVRALVERIARERRREGETAFPSLGQLVEPLQATAAARQRERAQRKQRESEWADFWCWVEEQKAESGRSEQEILDSIRVPGYTGLKARNAIPFEPGFAQPGRG